MVRVVMADHDVADFLESCQLGRSADPLGVAIIVRESDVDQQRFSVRRHNQRGRSAFDVNPIQFQILGLCVERSGAGK